MNCSGSESWSRVVSEPVYDPENYCPICGATLDNYRRHHCDGKSLVAIDAARVRDYILVRVPHLAERLKDGFQMLDDEEQEDDDLMRVCPGYRNATMIHWF